MALSRCAFQRILVVEVAQSQGGRLDDGLAVVYNLIKAALFSIISIF